MIRLILVALTLVLFFIIMTPAYLVLLLVKKNNLHASSSAAQAIVRFAFKLVLFCAGAKVTVKGLENIPRDTPVLFTSNHRSYADIPIIYTTVPVLTGIVAKKEIKKVPFLSWWMGLVNCLFLDRDNLKEGMKTILHGIDLVKQGYSICIMPEGTRNHQEELLPFKEGSFKIAEKTGCPIVPVAITRSDNIFELHQPWVHAAKVTIWYGEPIRLDELEKEDRKFIGQRIQSTITGMLKSLE